MQIGIDLGATKIEYVLLNDNNVELQRDRVQTPKDYENTIITITEIVKKLEKNSGKFNVGICHPGAVDKTTGLIKNAHNSQWLNKKNLIKDLKLKMDNNFFSENDANCFCLSEAFDGSASHYETVFGIILGSGCGGGLVINKKIISRHPNVFSKNKRTYFNWEKEKHLKHKRESRLDGVPKRLSALSRSQRLQQKASDAGFDWDNINPVIN